MTNLKAPSRERERVGMGKAGSCCFASSEPPREFRKALSVNRPWEPCVLELHPVRRQCLSKGQRGIGLGLGGLGLTDRRSRQRPPSPEKSGASESESEPSGHQHWPCNSRVKQLAACVRSLPRHAILKALSSIAYLRAAEA